MTYILHSERHRTHNDDCTIIVQKYQERGCRCPLWRILYRYDLSPYISFRTFKDGLESRPCRDRINQIVNAL